MTIRHRGANSLTERTLGGLDVFLPYVKDYVNTFIGKSITTQQWKDHLYGYYAKNGGTEMTTKLDSIDWDVRVQTLVPYPTADINLSQAWFYGEGTTLPVEMKYDTTLATKAYELAEKWNFSRDEDVSHLAFDAKDIEAFSSLQKSKHVLPSITHL